MYRIRFDESLSCKETLNRSARWIFFWILEVGIHINNIPCYRQRLQCSSNPRRTSHRNQQWLQKADRKPHWLVLPLLLLRGNLVGVTTVVVVGLKLSWTDESVAIVWENQRLRENGTSDHLLLSHLSFGFWFREKYIALIFGFLRRERSNGFHF